MAKGLASMPAAMGLASLVMRGRQGGHDQGLGELGNARPDRAEDIVGDTFPTKRTTRGHGKGLGYDSHGGARHKLARLHVHRQHTDTHATNDNRDWYCVTGENVRSMIIATRSQDNELIAK